MKTNQEHADEIAKESDDLKRNRITELLERCTEPQRELFGKMYPNGIPSDKLNWAYSQVARTVEKNEV